MATMTRKRRTIEVKPGFDGFVEFCEMVEFPLEKYMRRIAKAYFDPSRETVIVLPRGNAKTTIGALIALHHLLSVPGASVAIGAASVAQARIAFERAQSFLACDALVGIVIERHLELRYDGPEGRRLLRVLPSDGPRTHGLSCTLYVGDEVWAWAARADLLTAFQTGLVKRPDSKLLLISTSSGDLDSPLGRFRKRAMALPSAKRSGPIVEASNKDLHWLEWSLADEHDLDNLEAVERVNPAPWIGTGELRRQLSAVSAGAFGQFHCCRWGIRESQWLPPGAWAACQGEATFTPGEQIWVGIDLGGNRSASAVVWMNAQLHVGVEILQGDDAVLDAAEVVVQLAEEYQIAEIAYDPWRAAAIVKEFEHRGIKCTAWPWTDSRVIPAAGALYDAIVERRITHPGDEDLDRHMATVVGRATRRGLRIDKANETDQIDGAAGLLMALESATAPPPAPTEVLGWL